MRPRDLTSVLRSHFEVETLRKCKREAGDRGEDKGPDAEAGGEGERRTKKTILNMREIF